MMEPTQKQLDYLAILRFDGESPKTQAEASAIIDDLRAPRGSKPYGRYYRRPRLRTGHR